MRQVARPVMGAWEEDVRGPRGCILASFVLNPWSLDILRGAHAHTHTRVNKGGRRREQSRKAV